MRINEDQQTQNSTVEYSERFNLVLEGFRQKSLKKLKTKVEEFNKKLELEEIEVEGVPSEKSYSDQE